MKNILVVVISSLLFVSPAFSQDIFIDIDGNLELGTTNPDGKLEVMGESNKDAIIGSTSGNGVGVFGENVTTQNIGYLGHFNYGVFGYSPGGYGVYGYTLNGYAGYFQGNTRVTGNLTVDGLLTGSGIGDITGVTAGTGLTGGGLSGDVSMDISFAGTGTADNVARSDHNHDTSYSSSSHGHSGNDITTGTIIESHIDSAIARDSEILPTVLNNDGDGSGIDADLLDGMHASEIMSSGGGVPSGYLIMSESPTPPAGYIFTGETFNSNYKINKPMPTPRVRFSSAEVNNKIYVIGGDYNNQYLAKVEEYDPTNDTWTTKTPMPTARRYFGVAVINGKIYAVGGSAYINDITEYYAALEEYDPVTDTWTTKSPMSIARRIWHAGAANGKLYALSGKTASSTGSYLNEEYDPVTDTWTTKAPTPEMFHEGFAKSINNKIYLMGRFYFDDGEGLRNSCCVNYEYNPTSDSWTPKTLFSDFSFNFGGFTINNKLHTFGFHSIYEYDSQADAWTPKFLIRRFDYEASSFFINDSLYMINFRSNISLSMKTFYIHRKI